MTETYRHCMAIILLCFVSTGLSSQPASQPALSSNSYRILLSNDDGIGSPLLAVLHRELAALPGVEVVVAAPDENKSGSSHSSDSGPTIVDRFYLDGEFFGYAVHGRPADAVRFGLIELGKEQPFDLVVSGINRGANVGDVSHLSGTVGAAMEGIYQGVPAIAISQDTEEVDTVASARFTAQLVSLYVEQGAPEGILISINIPGGDLKGIRVRPMGDSYLQTAGYDLLEQGQDRLVYERRPTVNWRYCVPQRPTAAFPRTW